MESLATKYIFKFDGSNTLDNYEAELFHTTVDRGLFLRKIARLDIQPKKSVLCTRVKQPNQRDWNKLTRIMKDLLGTQELCIELKSDKTSCLKCYVDAAFVVHSYFNFHTRTTLTMGKVAIISMSQKQKLNMKSSTGSILVGADDAPSLILWTNFFRKQKDVGSKTIFISK